MTQSDEQAAAGLVLMTYGMHYEHTRILRELLIAPYKGTMQWHFEVWTAIYSSDETKAKEGFDEWARKAFSQGKHGLGSVVFRRDEDSEFGWIQKYYRPCTHNPAAGIRTLATLCDDEDGNTITMCTATPVFDSFRNYYLVLDKVEVWDSGAEATITAHFWDDEDYSLTFYDTNYLENKERYYQGAVYQFDLYGIVCSIEVVPEDKRSFQFEGQKAIDFNKKIGHEQVYDDNGVPKPVVFDMSRMHAFFQNNDGIPELVSFNAPVKRIYNDIDILGNSVKEIEIGLPYHNPEHSHDEEHPLSIFVSSEKAASMGENLVEDLPIHGWLYLQGCMREAVNLSGRPSTRVHSFDAVGDDGHMSVFVHQCADGEVGEPMTAEECEEFAKTVFAQHLAAKISLEPYEGTANYATPHFKASRKRDIWIKADTGYQAVHTFLHEDVSAAVEQYYRSHRFAVIAYVTLFDENGQECQWVKGGTYTARFHYGSATPGQKMEVLNPRTHDQLVEILYQSFLGLWFKYTPKIVVIN